MSSGRPFHQVDEEEVESLRSKVQSLEEQLREIRKAEGFLQICKRNKQEFRKDEKEFPSDQQSCETKPTI